MANTIWGDTRGPNSDLWSGLVYVVARWYCQLYGQGGEGAEHIRNPGVHNEPCGMCCAEASEVVEEGFAKLLDVFGSIAYTSGADRVPEDEAARRALEGTIARADRIERVKELLAKIVGPDLWWRSPSDDDEEENDEELPW
jgi:hypothetical protein